MNCATTPNTCDYMHFERLLIYNTFKSTQYIITETSRASFMKQPMKTDTAKTLRVHICQGLHAVLQQKQSLNDVLTALPSKLSSQDKASIQAGLYGVLRHYPTLSWLINQHIEKPLKNKDMIVEYLLCFALFQLIHQQKPPYAVANESVNTVTALGKSWAKGLVNAVLRKLTANLDTLTTTMQTPYQFDHPLWWQDILTKAWPSHWQAILTANNQQGPMCLRVNTQKTSVADYLQQLSSQGIAATRHAIATHAIVLTTPCPVHELPGFSRGLVSIQDASAQMVAPLLDLAPGLQVLDACAAPGGKSCHILEIEPSLSVTALDVVENRTSRITDNLKRLGQKAKIIIGDASQPQAWWDEKPFDRILCDVPCSASGIIRRHPDIKYLRQEEDLTQLPKIQLAILSALWPLLAPGGVLVYSTCSVMPQENDAVIAKWLTQVNDAVLVNLPENLGLKTTYGRQRLPGDNDMDGFYYAKIVKQI